MAKRKYPEVVGYWVYSIQIPSINKYYIGVSKQKCYERWRKTNYKGKSLEPYLNEWDNLIKTVLIDGLNKEDAYKYEGKIIDALSMNNLCINNQRSGLIRVNDINAYHRELYQTNTEYRERRKQHDKQSKKQRYENDVEYREKVNQRCKQYYENNKEKILEQQKQRYERKKLEKQQQTSVH